MLPHCLPYLNGLAYKSSTRLLTALRRLCMQASLNELKERHPRLIEIVGAQVMNTHSSFHHRMLNAGEAGRAAYDYALRTTSGYEPGVDGKCCDGKVAMHATPQTPETSTWTLTGTVIPS